MGAQRAPLRRPEVAESKKSKDKTQKISRIIKSSYFLNSTENPYSNKFDTIKMFNRKKANYQVMDSESSNSKRYIKRDQNAPKRANSSYMYFSIEMNPIIKRDHPQLNFHELAKQVSKLWYQLTDDEKQPYFKKYEVDRERYYREKKAYEAKKNTNISLSDEKNFLIGLDDGVFDIKKKIFRKMTPNDMIFNSTGYLYKKYTTESNDIIFLKEILNQIFPVNKELEEFLIFCKKLLNGNAFEPFIIFQGNGGSGMSTIQSLLKSLMGNYYIYIREILDINIQEVNKFVHLKGKRLCFVELSDPKSVSPVMRGIANELFFTFKNQTTFIAITNLEIKNLFKIKIFKFRSSFVASFIYNQHIEKEYEYKIDSSIIDKVRTMGQAFFWMLTQYKL